MYINEDLRTDRFKNYLFFAGVGESNTHFHVLYGKYSKELAIKIIKERPLIYLKTIIKALFYSLLGVFFFSGFIYEPQLINLPLYHKLFCLGFSPVYILGYLGSFIIIFYCILLKFHNKIVDLNHFDNKLFFLFNISLIVIVYIILTSMTACCENSRYSVSISGLLVLEFGFLFNIFSKAYTRHFLSVKS